MIALVEERQARLGIAPLCAALGLARATFYRRRGGPPPGPVARPPRRPPVQALTPAERTGVLALLHEDRFVDRPPAQVWAQVLDAGQVPPCSIRTMYRVLAAHAEVRERRDQLRHPVYRKPELLATGPNQVWSWDITKLLGPVTWTYYYLYVLLDIFSRYVVGWLLARQESAALAKVLITESCERQHIGHDQLIIHADRGPSMTSQPVALLLATLGVVPSHSRPHVSNDNPFSEAQFKTLKYQPDFPDRFGAYEDAETFGQRFFPWYNREHRHGALGLMTPHPAAAADGGVDQQAPGVTGAPRARGSRRMTATHKFPMPTVSFGLTTSAELVRSQVGDQSVKHDALHVHHVHPLVHLLEERFTLASGSRSLISRIMRPISSPTGTTVRNSSAAVRRASGVSGTDGWAMAPRTAMSAMATRPSRCRGEAPAGPAGTGRSGRRSGASAFRRHHPSRRCGSHITENSVRCVHGWWRSAAVEGPAAQR